MTKHERHPLALLNEAMFPNPLCAAAAVSQLANGTWTFRPDLIAEWKDGMYKVNPAANENQFH